jgi:hypothetical protein
MTVPVASILGLSEDAPVGAWDFWSRRMTVVRDGRLTLELPPHGSAVLNLAPLLGEDAPQYAGSDRHVLANPGIAGLECAGAGLTGAVEIMGDEKVSLYFRLPAGWAPDFDSVTGCLPELVREDLLRVDLAGEHATRLSWRVPRAEGYYVF